MQYFKRTIYSILIVAFLLVAKNAFGSPQMPDYVIYKRDTIAVYNLILEEYLETANKSDQGSLFGLKFRDTASLNCWRGYQAIYSIENDSLFLNDIIDCGELNRKKSINREASMERIEKIFKNKGINGKVFLDWYTGQFSLPNGNLLRWDGVFHKTFEKEKLIKVEEGKITNISEISNYIDEPDRINRRYQDSLSSIFFTELKKIKWKNIDRFDCSETYLIAIDEKGRISGVSMAEYQTKEDIKESWDKNEYNYCIRTLFKELKDLKFDILKMNGQPIEEKVFLEIWIEEDGRIENWTN